MAVLDDLVSQVSDTKLRAQLRDAVGQLRRRQKFGLIFEEHVPETTALFGLPITTDSLVQLRSDALAKDLFKVGSLSDDGKTATLIAEDGHSEEAAIDDLLSVKRFGEPMYAALHPLQKIERASKDRGHHAVINGENFHSLQLLSYLLRRAVDCIYIDPPYNTGATHWKYNNRFVDKNDGYRHSKFLAFLERRLKLAKKLLKPDGVLIVTIDKNEVHRVALLLEKVFPDYEQHVVAIVINPKGTNEDNFARTNEFALFCVPSKTRVGYEVITGRPAAAEDDRILESQPEADNAANDEIGEDEVPEASDAEWEYWGLIRGGQESSKRSARPNQFYPMYLDEASQTIVEVGQSIPASVTDYPKGHDSNGRLIVWPMGKDGKTERVWRYEASRMRSEIEQGHVRVGLSNKRWTFALRRTKKELKRVRTVWWDSLHDAGLNGSALLERFVPQTGFPFPKSLYAVKDCIDTVCRTRPNALILDFFAGSGTTLHATALLNAEDGGTRRCVLVTNNELDPKADKAARKEGHLPGDSEYESQGIFYSVTQPRVAAAITGKRADGSPIEGKYKDRITRKDTKRTYAAGFEENVEFYELKYIDPDDVGLGEQFSSIHPGLWLASGARGERLDPNEGADFHVAPNSPYAILFKPRRLIKFLTALSGRPDITHVWIVTDSDAAYAESCEALPDHVLFKSQLYRDYLRTFRVNGGSP